MRRLLVLAPNPITSASTRFRLIAYFDALRAAGFDPVLRSFFDQAAFDVLYQPGHALAKANAAIRALSNRVVDVARASRADVVLVHREAALIGPPLLEWLVKRALGRPLIFDFDDALWVPYASPTYGAALSRLLKAPWKTQYTVGAADLVMAGNPHLASWAKARNDRVEVFPTVVDTGRFFPNPRQNEVPVLGWIGTHSTAPYLQAIVPALQRLAQLRNFVLRVVGGRVSAPGVNVIELSWQLDREVADFQCIDIGLYPLQEDPWSIGKSAFKAIEYMACGIPVVASPVGFTATVVAHARTGYWARTDDEYVEYLIALLDDVTLRKRMGAAGRADAVEKWSLAVYAPRFVDAVRAVCDTEKPWRI